MIATIQAAISGHATATTIRAETVPLTMQRVASLLPPAQLKDAMTSCSQALRLIINQRLVKSMDGKWTPLREFLVCDAPYQSDSRRPEPTTGRKSPRRRSRAKASPTRRLSLSL